MRHVILIIEDDPHIARDLKELLESFGYDTIHCDNAEDARKAAAERQFCLILLDLQMKARASSIDPRVAVGLALLEYLRAALPGRTAKRKDLLQILVMSAYAKEDQHIIRAFQDGANDFIKKPIDDAFRDKLRQAFRHSEREKHDDDNCAALTSRARESGPADDSRIELSISGKEGAKKTEVTIAGHTLALSDARFLLLIRLVAGRLRAEEEGWVHKHQLGAPPSGEGWHAVTRLVESVAQHLPKGAELVENASPKFRLHPNIHLGPIDWRRLARHSESKVVEIAKEFSVPRT